MHFGLQLPHLVSTFPSVKSVSVSDYRVLKRRGHLRERTHDGSATYASKLDKFNARSTFDLPRGCKKDVLANISFYAFWRLFDVENNKIRRRQREAFIAITGMG